MNPSTQSRFAGYYYDGRSANRYPVHVVLYSQRLDLFFQNGQRISWPYGTLRLTRTGSTGPIRLERTTVQNDSMAESLVVEDPGFLEEAHRVAPGALGSFFTPPHRRNLRRTAIILGIFFVPVFLFGVYKFGLPALSDVFAGNIPVEWEEKLGETVYESMFQPPLKEPPPEIRKALDTISQRLLATVPDQPYTFKVYVHPADLVNALALPGGTVVVFQGLINATESPEELAGVLAHEYQHVLLKHSTRGMIRQMALSIVLAAVLGDSTALGGILEMAGELESLRHSRALETEADREGMHMILASGIDPDGMVRIFKKLEEEELRMMGMKDSKDDPEDESEGGKDEKGAEDKEQEGMPEWMNLLSTHPAGKDRVAMLTRMSRGPTRQARPLLPDLDWKSLHREAKSGALNF